MIKKHVLKGARMACAILCLGLVATSTQASESFSFDDIHYWVGEGTNRAGIVIDWNNGRPGSSLAWGVRWNGASTNLTYWLHRITEDDKRLHLDVSPSGYGTSLDAFAYDADGDGGIFDFVHGLASDPDDFIRVREKDPPHHYWASTCANGEGFGAGMIWDDNWYGLDGMFVENNGWFGFEYRTYVEYVAIPAVPVFAESPFAYRVVEFSIDSDMEENADETAALGRPSRLTIADSGPASPVTAVTPVIPAWQSDQVFSLSKAADPNSGFITVAFDHKVMDHPLNPYGLDFIIFGNFICQGSGGKPEGDPSMIKIIQPEYMDGEPGKVEVSQNGVDWFEFTNGPYADSFAPTFGFRYDPANADPALYEGNLWWGQPTDPTLPIDPRLSVTNFFGKTLAEMAILYNGSAGGTGFDIGELDLPVDPKTGQKWIQYVRVTSLAEYDPDQDGEWTEVDAIAAVSPALPYDNWAREHYAWTDLPNAGIVGKEVVAANGKPNFYNAAFGTAPDRPPVENFTISAFSIEGGRAVFRLPFTTIAYDAFRVGKASVVDGNYRDRLPTFEGTVENERGVESVFSIPVAAGEEKAFYKVGISAQ